MRYEIRLSGSGGQGMILAGLILAEAAAIYDGKNATQSQSYGPEARGGASKSDVIISDEDINYPKAAKVDLLLALTQEAYDKYVPDLKDDGILVIDGSRVAKLSKKPARTFALPILDVAQGKVGKIIVANIVALGAIVEISKVVSAEAIETAVLSRVPRGTEELNKRALQAGFEVVRNFTQN
jgi:2-oxoglutarate ferredoxin oxidoreductase subunit gamma